MGKILSQAEIDELLGALSSGSVDADEIKNQGEDKKVELYDFKRPSKFSKEHLRTLEIISENYARDISTYLSGNLRSLVNIEVVGAEEVTYSEFINSQSDPVLIGVVEFSPLNGSIMMEISRNMGYSIIERVLGGQIKGCDKVREFTDIELIILNKTLKQLTELLVRPWENVLSLKPRLDGIKTNAQMVQLISPNEMIAVITFGVTVGPIEELMHLCIPHLVIEPIMEKLNTKYWFVSESDQNTNQFGAQVARKIEKTEVPVKAILGKTHITVNEFLNLEANDIIKLDQDVSSEIDVHVGNIRKFTGIVGTYKDKVALKVVDVIEREAE